VLSGGYFPTGSIVFTLTGPGGFTFTTTDTVTGNGTYTASTTLPTTGAVAGTYTWTVRYGGDANNTGANDQAGPTEQTVVGAASPSLVTTASPNVTLPAGPPGTVTLSDSALLSGGQSPTGSIVFTLTGPGGFTFTTTDTVTGNGTYTATTTLPTSGTVVGTYTWTAHYSGDANNAAAADQGGSAEQTAISSASPTLRTTASPSAVTLPAPIPTTLSDSAVLSEGYFPTGSIVFTLTGPGGFVFSHTDTVSGNGTYTASTTLPTTGTVAGTYIWTARYGGDANNSGANDQGGPTEQTAVGTASPSLVTTASPNVTLPAGPPGTVTLSDSALLSGGQSPTGSIVFTLTGPGGFTFTTTDTVTGNGTYTASTTLPATVPVAGTYTWTVTYSGDANNAAAADQGGSAEQTLVSTATPTEVTTASPSTVTLPVTGSTTLSDSAVLSGGYFPTGSIVFTLTGPGGFTFTTTDTVTGNGTYTASTTLPTTGAVAGTYTWTVRYGGDANNSGANDQAGPTEQTVVGSASPALVTTASPNVTLPAGPPGTVTLSDSALLSGGDAPTGSIVFTLTGPGGFTHTQTDTVSGNGTYTASTTLPTTGTVAGAYLWTAHYSGDANNAATNDQGGSAEQTLVAPASPTLLTTATPTTLTLPAPAPTALSDSAVLSGGYFPTGSIVFTLTGPGGFTFTTTDTVSGNGTYTASTTLPTTGTVAGTYIWTAHYSGDANNHGASDSSPVAAQTVVHPTSPTLSTIASPNTVALPAPVPTTLSDSALLSGGLNPTGSIVFTLTGPGGFTFTTTDTVSGNGIYTASTTLPTTGAVAGTYTWSVTYGGDSNNNGASDSNPAAEQTVVAPASPSLVTTASPSTVTLPATGPTTLSDSGVLSGGLSPTGSIVFTLTGPGGFTFTTTATVTGNGTYTASTTLPTTGTVAGTYTWTARYGGDGNNTGANDQAGPTEQSVVGTASPSLVTTASPNVTLAAGPPGTVTLSDSALLSGGDAPTGSIDFMLTGPSGVVFTTTDAVNGNGTYRASTTLPTTGTVVGTYTWTVHYSGDPNNAPADDQGGSAEQTLVAPTSPTLVTTANPTTVTLPVPVPTALSDSALLSNGYFPGGSIVFTLTGPGGFTFTTTDTVTGNGTYTASTTLPTTGTVAGTYTWTAHYSGDPDNNPANDQGGATEQTVVSTATPTLVTVASPATVTLLAPVPTALSDSAVLSGGCFPGGSIGFTLRGPGGFVFTTTATVTGNGTYTASTTLPTTRTVVGTYTWTAHYSGDPNNNPANDQGGIVEQTVVRPFSPTLATKASPATVTLLAPVPTTLSDSAVLLGFNPTGSIVFTLRGPSGFVFTTTDAVSGSGTYTASTTLPTTGTVAGTYTWTVHYSGDANNAAANDQGGPNEKTVIHPVSPTLVTTASPGTVTLPAPDLIILSDSALLSGGFRPSSTIVFTLTGPGGFVFTQTDAVSGNGAYTASTTLPTTAVAGTYTWTAHYSGDGNNAAANDQGGATEQVTVTEVGLSSLGGSVYFDTNQNSVRDPGELGIPGVTITLTGTQIDGRPVFATVVTDANGDFLFEDLFDGTYTLTETPPPNMILGQDRAGSLGGVLLPDTITDISVDPAAATNYSFGVLGLSDPSKYWLLSNTNLAQLFGPPGSGVTDVNPGAADPPPLATVGAVDPPPALLVTQTATGSQVQVFAAGSRTAEFTLDPFPGYLGRLALAEADVTGNGTTDIIVATAQGSSAVKVFDGQTGALLESYLAFPGFDGGLSLTTGDVTGAGYADIIVGTATGTSYVGVFDGRSGTALSGFLAFGGYDGGVQVSAGDATGTGRADIAVAPLSGSSNVKVFDGQSGALLQSFMAFPGFTGNISLAYVPVNGVLGVLYVGTATGGSEVKAFGPDDSLLQDFVAYPGFGGGVQLAAGDATGSGQSDLLTLAVGTTHEKVFAPTGAERGSFFAAPGAGVDLADSLLWFARQQIV
jgi:hypothetical protein